MEMVERRLDRWDAMEPLLRAIDLRTTQLVEQIPLLRRQLDDAVSDLRRDIQALCQRADGHDARFDAHDRRFDRIEARLDEHDRRFDEHDRRFDRIEARLDEHDRRFDRIEARLDVHDRRFDELSTKMDERSARAEEIFEALRDEIRSLGRGWQTP